VLAVGALIGLDALLGGGAHLTHTLSSSSGPGDLGKVVVRRWRLSLAGLTHGTTPISVGIALVVLVWGALHWRSLLEPLRGESERPLRAAIVGSFFAVVIGAIANDSGPMIVLIGTFSLVLSVGYVKYGTPYRNRPNPGLTSHGCA
jgi:hypothetical protein